MIIDSSKIFYLDVYCYSGGTSTKVQNDSVNNMIRRGDTRWLWNVTHTEMYGDVKKYVSYCAYYTTTLKDVEFWHFSAHTVTDFMLTLYQDSPAADNPPMIHRLSSVDGVTWTDEGAGDAYKTVGESEEPVNNNLPNVSILPWLVMDRRCLTGTTGGGGIGG